MTTPHPTPQKTAAALGIAVALAGILLLPEAAGAPPIPLPPTAGGAIQNRGPAIEGLAPHAATVENSGQQAILVRGEIQDANGEQTLVTLQAEVAGAAPAFLGVTRAHLEAALEPDSRDLGGWKLWNPQDRDGRLSFEFWHPVAAFAPAGPHDVTVRAADRAGLLGAATVQVTVVDFRQVDLMAEPVDLQGTPQPGAWGGWIANPGDRRVESGTYLKVVNSGAAADAVAVLDFNEDRFGSASSSAIPLDGNIEFAVWEDATPASTSPAEGHYVFQAPASQGSVEIRFSGSGNVAYVKYRIVDMPQVLEDQAYRASLTLTVRG